MENIANIKQIDKFLRKIIFFKKTSFEENFCMKSFNQPNSATNNSDPN